MFRKLVTNLSFSPSLIGELGAYNLRLKHEQTKRGIGLFLLALALIIQTLAVSFPPESANSAHENDIVYGGVSSVEELIAKYDQNDQNLRDIYNSLGVTRSELLALEPGVVRPANGYYIAGRTSQISFELGERPYGFNKAQGGKGTLYFAPSDQLDTAAHAYTYKTYKSFVGHSEQLGPLAVIASSGNIVLQSLPQTISHSVNSCAKSEKDAHCQPCPTNSHLTVGDTSCTLPVTYTKSATNSTQNQLAANTPARASDRITYTIRAKNISDTIIDVPFSDNLKDVLEYADVVSTNGGTFNTASGVISWPDVPVRAGETVSRSFSVRLKPHLPATAQGLGNPMSYDCVMTNTNTNTISISVACPLPKVIESITTELPQTSASTSTAAGIVLLIIAGYLYLRAKQQREELRLIRKDVNAGTL